MNPNIKKILLQLVRDLNKKLREQALSLEDIAEKIETKLRKSFFGAGLHQRIQELFQLGFDRFESSKNMAPFIDVFVRHAYVYGQDETLLKNSVAQMIEALNVFDRAKRNEHLKNIFLEILAQENKAPLLQALVENENFIKLAQQKGFVDEKLKEAILSHGSEDEICDLVVFLGDVDLFHSFSTPAWVIVLFTSPHLKSAEYLFTSIKNFWKIKSTRKTIIFF